MARFGIEGIRYFGGLRDSGVFSKDDAKTISDLTYVFNICNGLDEALRDGGHTRSFYWANDDCWEIDLRSSSQGGIDSTYADEVDLFFILTHGNNVNGSSILGYNVKINEWIGNAATWQLGDTYNLEWLLIYGCKTVDLNNVWGLGNVFQRLHQICGAYDNMYDGITTDECGEDVGDNLTDGDTVAEAWIDGVSDWYVDNHPIVVSCEVEATYRGGNFDWPQTTLNRDHLWGEGTTVSDALPYWLSWRWAEG
jgi:Family of unknown function (DUF6345)